MRPALPLLAAVSLILASSAQAAGPPASAESLLTKGGVWVASSPDPDKVSAHIEAAVDIAATPQQVWRTMTDCRNAYRLIDNLKSCKIVEGDMAKGWDVREHISKSGILPTSRVVFRSDYTPYSDIRFKLVEGDLKIEQGEWKLIPLNGGSRTRVVYRNRLALNIAVPQGLLVDGLKKAMPRGMTKLRDLCEQQAKGG
jgi:hypothetical protein